MENGREVRGQGQIGNSPHPTLKALSRFSLVLLAQMCEGPRRSQRSGTPRHTDTNPQKPYRDT